MSARNHKYNASSYEDENNIVLLCFLFLYVGTFMLQANDRISLLGTIRFEFILGATLVAISLCIKPDINNQDTKPLLRSLFFFYLCLFFAVFLSKNFDDSWNTFFDRVLKFSFMALFISRLCTSSFALKVFTAAFVLSCLKMGQEGLLGQISGSLVWQNQGIMRLHGSTEMYRHPNSFSGMAIGTLPFIFYLYPIADKKIKIILAALLIFTLNIILFTGSRTGYVALFGFLVLAFLKSERKFMILNVLVITSILAIPSIPQEYKGRFNSIFTGEEAEGKSTEGRKQLFFDSVDTFTSRPWGIGVNAFMQHQKDMGRRSQDTHNLYTQILTNIGLQGFIAFTLFIIAIFNVLKKTKKKANHLIDVSIVELRKLYQNTSYPPPEDFRRVLTIDKLEANIRFIIAVCNIAFLYLAMRLILGVFGHDLYEIYWWIVLGLTIATSNIITKIGGRVDNDIKKLKNMDAVEAK